MKNILVVFACFGAFFCSQFSFAQEAEPTVENGRVTPLWILETVLQINGDPISTSVTNSRIAVKSQGIKLVAARGPEAIPALLSVMESDELTFDTFVRCYSACQEIIFKDSGQELLWYGGMEIRQLEMGGRYFPSGQLNEFDFRNEIVQDIRKKVGRTGPDSNEETGNETGCHRSLNLDFSDGTFQMVPAMIHGLKESVVNLFRFIVICKRELVSKLRSFGYLQVRG